MRTLGTRFAVGCVVLGISGLLLWHDTSTHALLETVTAQHQTDSIVARKASQTADSVLLVADSLRHHYRTAPAVAPLLAQNLALQDSLAKSRQVALESLVDSTAGLDSLRVVIRRLVASGAHGDSVSHALIEELGRQVVEAGQVITQDSLSLTAMVRARDAERTRAVSAERLAAAWRQEAARVGSERRMWQILSGGLAVMAFLRP